MNSSNIQNQSDPLQNIYFEDFLKTGRKRKWDLKLLIFFLLCHILILGTAFGIYMLISKGVFSNFSIKLANENENSGAAEVFSLSASDTSIMLNLDEDESQSITFIANSDSNPEKNLSILRGNSEIVTIESVNDDPAGQLTYVFTAKKIGSDSISFKLVDTDNSDTIYDTKTIKVKVTGTLDHGIFDNHSYQIFETSLSWAEAKEACEVAGGHLATINSVEEQDFIQDLIKSTKRENLWLGGTYSISNGTWNWVDGTPLEYTNWDTAQPDNYTGDEYYIRIKNRDKTYADWEAFDGKWNDTANAADDTETDADAPISSFGYVCEWDFVETTIVGGLKPSNLPSEITDYFGNHYTKDNAFLITAVALKDSKSELSFDFNKVNYRTLNYDISCDMSIVKSLSDDFENSTPDDAFLLCDILLVAVQEDGTKIYCEDGGIAVRYGLFSDRTGILPLHRSVILPENTVEIRFQTKSFQSDIAVKMIIANATLTTVVNE